MHKGKECSPQGQCKPAWPIVKDAPGVVAHIQGQLLFQYLFLFFSKIFYAVLTQSTNNSAQGLWHLLGIETQQIPENPDGLSVKRCCLKFGQLFNLSK